MANTQTTVPIFVAAQVLEAAQLNNSAATGVPVFATTVTRDAGFGGAGEKPLAEGQLCYLESTNVVQYYDGAAWATVGPAPAVSSGLTLITSGTLSNTTSVNNCFSATYQNYKIVLNSYVGPAADTVRFRLRVGGTDNSAANYSALGITCNLNTGTLSASTQKNATFWSISQSNDMANGLNTSWDLLNPFEAKNTNYTPLTFFYGDLTESFIASGIHVSATSFDGFTIFPNTGTLTGTYKVYGYSS
jgi:hypothetical protein